MDRDTVTIERTSTVLVLQQPVHEKAPPHHLSSEEVNPPLSSTRARINLENSSTKQHYAVLSENPAPCCANKGEIQHSHSKAQPGAGAVAKPAQSSPCHVSRGGSSRDPRASCTSGLTRGGGVGSLSGQAAPSCSLLNSHSKPWPAELGNTSVPAMVAAWKMEMLTFTWFTRSVMRFH